MAEAADCVLHGRIVVQVDFLVFQGLDKALDSDAVARLAGAPFRPPERCLRQALVVTPGDVLQALVIDGERPVGDELLENPEPLTSPRTGA